ncbi:hypothetical protein FHX74_001659 [Friedmanniella endophytica]|uniref:Uncharacterized protein n=1 Tax=Microlunatus kandeliicorticis TaxID=1759536 RepID=A0A7W3P5J6_9ACTN|nr:hypothetical protein [Microlunatus kandeliicorticis]
MDSHDEARSKASALLRQRGLRYDNIYDPADSQLDKLAGNLPTDVLPSTIVLDKQGRLAVRILGPVNADTLLTEIEAVNHGR